MYKLMNIVLRSEICTGKMKATSRKLMITGSNTVCETERVVETNQYGIVHGLRSEKYTGKLGGIFWKNNKHEKYASVGWDFHFFYLQSN